MLRWNHFMCLALTQSLCVIDKVTKKWFGYAHTHMQWFCDHCHNMFHCISNDFFSIFLMSFVFFFLSFFHFFFVLMLHWQFQSHVWQAIRQPGNWMILLSAQLYFISIPSVRLSSAWCLALSSSPSPSLSLSNRWVIIDIKVGSSVRMIVVCDCLWIQVFFHFFLFSFSLWNLISIYFFIPFECGVDLLYLWK